MMIARSGLILRPVSKSGVAGGLKAIVSDDPVVVGLGVSEVFGCHHVDLVDGFATRGLLNSNHAESKVSGTTIDQ